MAGSSTVRLAEGAEFGRYTIVRHLATGGMAEVYLARSPAVAGFEKRVVIKRMIPKLANDREFLDMFLDEARIAVTLQHPNLVEVFEVGQVDGTYFMVMEYLDGRDLRSIRRWFPLEQSLIVTIGLCAGLHYAHERTDGDGRPLQIVHRDVSPQNVIVSWEGEVKLLDFGVASATLRIGETRGGMIKGKLAYMSPEQCRGETLDRRSDIFSVGIMLWEMTVHARLFESGSDYDVLKKIVEGRIPRPTEIDPAYPPGLERVVMRALEKDPERRYQTAYELRMDLEALGRAMRLNLAASSLQHFMQSAQEKGQEPRARSITPSTKLAPVIELVPETPRRRVRPWMVGAVAAVVLFTTVGAFLRSRHHPRPPEKLPARPEVAIPAPSVERRDPPPVPSIAAPPVLPTHVEDPALPAGRHKMATTGSPTENEVPAPKPVRKARKVEKAGIGTLVLATSPWCEVIVDGEPRGPTPLTLKLSAGQHDIQLSNDDWKIHRSLPLNIHADETLRKKMVFPR
jgi:serine/threonine protein kinase